MVLGSIEFMKGLVVWTSQLEAIVKKKWPRSLGTPPKDLDKTGCGLRRLTVLSNKQWDLKSYIYYREDPDTLKLHFLIESCYRDYDGLLFDVFVIVSWLQRY